MLQWSGGENRAEIAKRCRAKYPRGINFVAVDQKAVGDTFTPNFFVDPGRIFLTYERFMKEALDPLPDEKDPFYQEMKSGTIRQHIESYDPEKEPYLDSSCDQPVTRLCWSARIMKAF